MWNHISLRPNQPFTKQRVWDQIPLPKCPNELLFDLVSLESPSWNVLLNSGLVWFSAFRTLTYSVWSEYRITLFLMWGWVYWTRELHKLHLKNTLMKQIKIWSVFSQTLQTEHALSGTQKIKNHSCGRWVVLMSKRSL